MTTTNKTNDVAAHDRAKQRAITVHGVTVTYRCPRCNEEHMGLLTTWDSAAWWTCRGCENDVDVTGLVSIRWPHA